MEKVKIESIVKEVAGAALREAIVTAKPKYKGLTDSQLAEIFGLTEYQFAHLADKALGNIVAEKLEAGIENVLIAGKSLEVPHQFNVFVHTSKGTVSKEGEVISAPRLNKNGAPSKKLSVRTRRGIKEKLNN
jgi:hypothetical protein